MAKMADEALRRGGFDPESLQALENLGVSAPGSTTQFRVVALMNEVAEESPRAIALVERFARSPKDLEKALQSADPVVSGFAAEVGLIASNLQRAEKQGNAAQRAIALVIRNIREAERAEQRRNVTLANGESRETRKTSALEAMRDAFQDATQATNRSTRALERFQAASRKVEGNEFSLQTSFAPNATGTRQAAAQVGETQGRVWEAEDVYQREAEQAREAAEAIQLLEQQKLQAKNEARRSALDFAIQVYQREIEEGTAAAQALLKARADYAQASEIFDQTMAASAEDSGRRREAAEQRVIEKQQEALRVMQGVASAFTRAGQAIGSALADIVSGASNATQSIGKLGATLLSMILDTVAQAVMAYAVQAAAAQFAQGASLGPIVGIAIGAALAATALAAVSGLLSNLPSQHTGMNVESDGTPARSVMDRMPGRSSGTEGLIRVKGDETIRTAGQERALQSSMRSGGDGPTYIIEGPRTFIPPTGPEVREYQRQIEQIASGRGVSRSLRSRRSRG